MPTQIRPKGEAKKIAFSILGIPANMLYKKSKEQKELDNEIFLRQSSTSSKIF